MVLITLIIINADRRETDVNVASVWNHVMIHDVMWQDGGTRDSFSILMMKHVLETVRLEE